MKSTDSWSNLKRLNAQPVSPELVPGIFQMPVIDTIKRNHHSVPELYLKRWGNQNHKIHSYNLIVPSDNFPIWTERSIRSTCYLKDLYLLNSDVGLSDEIEDWFNTQIETPAAPAIEKALRKERLTTEDWKKLIRFVACQDIRTPRFRKVYISHYSENLSDETLHIIAKVIYNIPAPSVSHFNPELRDSDSGFPAIKHQTLKIRRSPVGFGYDIKSKIDRHVWFRAIRQALTTKTFTLDKYQWSILQSHTNVSWPTSDNPVVIVNQQIGEGRWERPNGGIFMPISPKMILVGFADSRPPQEYTTISHCA
jgi:hypothetical protein